MNITTIGSDPFLNRPIKKIIFDTPPKLQLFNESDVLIGHPSSNLAIAAIYTWKTDSPPETFRKNVEKLSNYAYLTGYWRTTNGARYVFSNILANPNVNKLFVLIFDAADNGHLLADALRNFWRNGTDEDGIIIGSKAQNPKFEQLSKEALERVSKQCDLVIVPNITERDFPELDMLLRKSIDEPENGANLDNSKRLSPEFISQIIKNRVIYDDGARFPEPFEVNLTDSAKKVRFTKKTLDTTIGQSIQAEDLDDALSQIASFVFEHGSSFEDERKIINIECRSLAVTIKDPLRKIPDGFSEGYIKDYVSEFMEGPKPDALLDYNYHDRIFKRWGNQVERVVTLLSDSEKARNTRRAVISLWDPAKDLENPTAPCLSLIWAVIRENRFEFHVLFRSHHLATITSEGKLMPGEGAFVPNIYALATLQDYMAKRLNIRKGPLVLTDFSGHLYMSRIK